MASIKLGRVKEHRAIGGGAVADTSRVLGTKMYSNLPYARGMSAYLNVRSYKTIGREHEEAMEAYARRSGSVEVPGSEPGPLKNFDG